ncbi:MAG: DUF1553 domain-containing protein [Planctomycetota bacterium]
MLRHVPTPPGHRASVQAVNQDQTPLTDDQTPISYNRDIRPILSDKCFSCHGPDNEHRAADLRLDTPEHGDEYDGAYFAIEPGNPDQSEFVRRIFSRKPSEVMPPPESKLTLTDEEKALLVRWIEEGAEYERHWSYEPIAKPDLPDVVQKDWSLNGIDTFVLARMESEGFSPNKAATRSQLLRRLTLDLTGLPPTAEELDAFLTDERPGAYERQVDRLLASSRFGERMALPWLDAARYADTNGFSIDDHRDMWLWREWVIDAYNRNMRYDTFVVQQIAGDLLPEATDSTRLATGFLRNSMNTHEGGTIPEEYRVIYIADKIDTVSSVFLGLTMRCAQCHDHKYDLLSMDEYYQMYAFFDTAYEPGTGATNANTPPVIRMDGPITGAAAYKQDIEQRIATLERYQLHPPELVADRAAWELQVRESARGDLAEALRTAVDERTDRQWGVINAEFAKTTVLWTQHTNTIGVEIGILKKDLEAGQSSVMVMKEQGPRQTYVLTRGEYDKPDHERPVGPGVPSVLPPLDPTEQADGGGLPAQSALPWQSARWVWDNANGAEREQDNAPRYFRFVIELDTAPRRADLRVTADNAATTYVNGQRLGTNDPWMTPAHYEVSAQLVEGKNVIAIEATNAGGVAGMLASLIIDGQAYGSNRTWKVNTQLGEGWASAEFDDSAWADASELGPASMPPWRIRVDERASKAQAPTRLDLAQWLVRPDHPLTARVAVNRTWQMFFGRGLVSTPNDFGAQGAFPTHPRLLDYLASSFIDSGWDTKQLVKQIVMSATYRQSSHAPRALYQEDPYNELLARGSRFRLPAEFIRDGALAVSQRLDPRVGGPSVYPRQPFGLWREVSHFGYAHAFTAQAFYPGTGDELNRRSMYTFWKRTSPPPALSAFDAPSREVCTVERSRTNTPLQALVLLNDPEYVDAARSLAELAIERGGGVEDRVDYMFRRATSRIPSDAERAVLVRRYGKAFEQFQRQHDAADALAGDGGPELAAWTVVAAVILNLDETMTRE